MSPAPDKTILFHTWLEEHRGILVKVARSFAPAPADAADLLQEMRLQLWMSITSFAGQAKPSTWIYRVCLNTALTWRRGRDRRDQHLEPDADITHLPAAAASPAEQAGDEELLNELYAGIHALPMFDRALMLLALDGLAYREIAEITGLTENHVGVSLTRARQRLAERMKGVSHEIQ
jgi:RNA polymerase sigma-70 factor (ECF subfamily)